MLGEILALCALVKNIVFYCILFSYKAGQLIVWGLQTCLGMISVAWFGVSSLVQIAGEDFHVWLCDLGARLGSALLWLVQGIEYLGRTLTDTLILVSEALLGTGNVVVAIHNTVIHVVSKISSCIINVFAWLKHMCVLVGWGVWFAVTFVPLSIVYLCINATYYFGRLVEELLQFLYTIYLSTVSATQAIFEFITDVPIESTIGLLIGGCFVYILLHCHALLFMLVRHAFTQLWESIRGHWLDWCNTRSSYQTQSKLRNLWCVYAVF